MKVTVTNSKGDLVFEFDEEREDTEATFDEKMAAARTALQRALAGTPVPTAQS